MAFSSDTTTSNLEDLDKRLKGRKFIEGTLEKEHCGGMCAKDRQPQLDKDENMQSDAMSNDMEGNVQPTQSAGVSPPSQASTNRLTILNLPVETLGQIFEYVRGHEVGTQILSSPPESNCNDHAIQNIRLTCRRFRDSSSHLLIHLLKLGVDQESLLLLNNVSRHPRISKGVDTVEFALRFYSPTIARNVHLFARIMRKMLIGYFELQEHRLIAASGTSDLSDTSKVPTMRIGECMRTDDASTFVEPEVTAKHIGKCTELAELFKLLQSWDLYLERCRAELVCFCHTSCSCHTVFASRLDRMIAEGSSSCLRILKDAHGVYKHRFNQQRKLMKKSKFVNSVATAFSCMPQARRLFFRSLPWSVETIVLRNPRVMDGTLSLAERVNAFVLPMNSEEAYYYRSRRIRESDNILKLPVTLPLAIHKAGVWLQAYQIAESHPENMTTFRMFLGEHKELKAAMQRLQYFSYAPSNVHCERLTFPYETEIIRLFLTSMIDTDTLKQISIHLAGYWYDREIPGFEMGSLLSFRSWPRLEELTVEGMGLDYENIEPFVDNLGASVHYNIKGCYLYTGTWADLLDALHRSSANHLSLTSPYGGERDVLSAEEITRVFDPRVELSGSLAEMYIRGHEEENPLRVEEVLDDVAEDN